MYPALIEIKLSTAPSKTFQAKGGNSILENDPALSEYADYV